MTQVVEWFFGRGLSIGCGLRWSVPEVWKAFSREDQVAMITQAIQEEMSAAHIDTRDIEAFLDLLATRTTKGWQHRFHTTNWDYLLRLEIGRRFPAGTVKPWWLASSHVYHHNGTAEMPSGDPFRSPLLLESDPYAARRPSPESDSAFDKLINSRLFVVVGMSFECAVDRFLFKALKRVQDDCPVGESCWLVVNPSVNALKATHSKILDALPAAVVCTQKSSFGSWVRGNFLELTNQGAISFQESASCGPASEA
jgi:hypothetical protein